MVTANQIQSLSQLLKPVVTVYLNTEENKPSRHPRVPSCLTWLRKQAEILSRELPATERAHFQRNLDHVQEFLDERRPQERSLVIYSGLKTWMVFPLQIPVENELAWGQPAIGQLFRLFHERKSSCIVAVDHRSARFFAYSLGELTKLAEKEFDVDPSQWKEKSLGHLTSGRIQKMRGPFPDQFKHRIEVQFARLCRETAKQAASLAKQHGLSLIFIAGPARLIGPMRTQFPAALKEYVCLVPEDLGNFSPKDLLQRLEPIIAEYAQKQQMSTVTRLLSADNGAVSSLDETLAQLQTGAIRSIIVSRDINPALGQCRNCGSASSAADRVCPLCAGDRRKVNLRDMLPGLLAASDTEVEIVSGEAARTLERAGGMGGWLRRARVAADSIIHAIPTYSRSRGIHAS
jgi:hypothetical protein